MKVTLTPTGATIDAHDLGPLFGIAPADVPQKMRDGLITSRSEQGIAKDEGHVRLTFWYQQQRVRLVCDSEGIVVKTTRTSTGPKSQ